MSLSKDIIEHISLLLEQGKKVPTGLLLEYGYTTQPIKKVDKLKFKHEKENAKNGNRTD